MFIVVESTWSGSVHVPGTASLLKALAAAFPDRGIRFVAEAEHLGHVRAATRIVGNVEFIKVAIPTQRAHPLERTVCEAAILRRALAGIAPDAPHFLVQASTNGSAIRVAQVFLAFRRGMRAWVRLHGNLNEIEGWRSQNPLTRFVSLPNALRSIAGGRLRAIVLDDSIRNALVGMMPNLNRQIDVVYEYPLPEETCLFKPSPINLPPLFGYLGLGTEAKGFDLFLECAKQSKKNGVSAKFRMIGPVHASMKALNLAVLEQANLGERLTREAYLSALGEIDYALLPYRPIYYRLSASGVIVDAMTALKPIVALPVPFIVDLFKQFGDIGYLCRDEVHFTETVAALAQRPDLERYGQQVIAMRCLRDARSMKSIVDISGRIFK